MSYDRKTEPTLITQGERIAWTRTFDDYPADEYTLEYRFRGNGTGFDVTGTADGIDFDAIVPATASLAATIGKYRWQAWLTEIADSTNKNMILEGTVEMLRGFASGTTTAIDMRSTAKQILDEIDAKLLSSAGEDVIEYEFSTPAGTRKVKRRSDLLTIRKEYARIVSNEILRDQLRNGGTFGKQVKGRIFDNG